MIDIELARKFVMNYIPPDGAIQVNEVWNFMKTEPLALLRRGLMFTQLEYIKSDTPGASQAAACGFINGFALAYCMQDPEFSKNVEEAVKFGEKVKGANVVDFLSRKKS